MMKIMGVIISESSSLKLKLEVMMTMQIICQNLILITKILIFYKTS